LSDAFTSSMALELGGEPSLFTATCENAIVEHPTRIVTIMRRFLKCNIIYRFVG